jgi:hypothetical protein
MGFEFTSDGGNLPYLESNFTLTSTGALLGVALLNDQIGGLVWSRVGVGSYKVTSAGLFTTNQTQIIIGLGNDASHVGPKIICGGINVNEIFIITIDSSDVPQDDILLQTAVIIRVW